MHAVRSFFLLALLASFPGDSHFSLSPVLSPGATVLPYLWQMFTTFCPFQYQNQALYTPRTTKQLLPSSPRGTFLLHVIAHISVSVLSLSLLSLSNKKSRCTKQTNKTWNIPLWLTTYNRVYWVLQLSSNCFGTVPAWCQNKKMRRGVGMHKR